MPRQKISSTIFVFAFSLGFLAIPGSTARAQSSELALAGINPGALQELGLHLPSYISSVQAQMGYQSKSPLHQEITVAWSPETAGPTSGSGLVLVKRWQHVQKAPGLPTLTPKDRPLLVIATTPGGEIRALILHSDTRSSNREFDLQLPQDGQISKLVFASVSEGWVLEHIGDVEVGSPAGQPIAASRSKIPGPSTPSK